MLQQTIYLKKEETFPVSRFLSQTINCTKLTINYNYGNERDLMGLFDSVRSNKTLKFLTVIMVSWCAT